MDPQSLMPDILGLGSGPAPEALRAEHRTLGTLSQVPGAPGPQAAESGDVRVRVVLRGSSPGPDATPHSGAAQPRPCRCGAGCAAEDGDSQSRPCAARGALGHSGKQTRDQTVRQTREATHPQDPRRPSREQLGQQRPQIFPFPGSQISPAQSSPWPDLPLQGPRKACVRKLQSVHRADAAAAGRGRGQWPCCQGGAPTWSWDVSCCSTPDSSRARGTMRGRPGEAGHFVPLKECDLGEPGPRQAPWSQENFTGRGVKPSGRHGPVFMT